MEMILGQSQTQGLAMTPRMQASLKILQMNNLDLSAHIAKEAEENPCLEVRLPETPLPRGVAGGARTSDFDAIAALAEDKPSLYAHAMAQVDLAFDHPATRRIAVHFVEALEPTGWLGAPVETIALQAGVPQSVAEAVLAKLRQFEPAGLFARSLGECLKLQAEAEGLLTWDLSVILDNLPMLADGRLAELAEMCDGTPGDVREALKTIRGLNPKPGLDYSLPDMPIHPPDLRVSRKGGEWVVELNRSMLPEIRVTQGPEAGRNAEARAYVSQARSRARWLARSVARRETTLLSAASCLVRRQADFLESGPRHLRPLTTEDVAEEMGVHASTVSRAVADRLIETPRGTVPLRSFFSRAFVPGTGEDGPSQTALVTLVAEIVAAENPARPLSDTAIVKQAQGAGVKLARRTVAKYRDMLGIPSSYERRQSVLESA